MWRGKRVVKAFDYASGQVLKTINDLANQNFFIYPFLAGDKVFGFSVRNNGPAYNLVMVFNADTQNVKDSFRVSNENYNLMTIVK
jgi:hypothetical protein